MVTQHRRNKPINAQSLVKIALVTVAASLVAACATGHPFKKETLSDDKQAIIYIYRPAKFLSSGETPDIYINGTKALALINGGYSFFRIKPGLYRVEIKKPSGPFAFMVSDFSSMVEFHADHSNTYFIRWSPELLDSSFMYVPVGSGAVLGSFKRAGNMALVQEQAAIAEISKCNYLETEPVQFDAAGE